MENPTETLSVLDRFVVVLCEPQDPINIGNTVRAIKNMGITRLRLVRPASFDSRCVSISAPKAQDLIERIEVFDTLDEALADTVMAVALTARPRRARRPCERPREALPGLLEKAKEGSVALLFGREDSGLSNAQIERAQLIVSIPTRADYSSLNLGQAVMVMAYELFVAAGNAPPLSDSDLRVAPAPLGQLEGMYKQIEDTLWKIDFFKSGHSASVVRTLRSVFHRSKLSEREVRTFRGIFTEVLQYARRAEERGQEQVVAKVPDSASAPVHKD